MPSYLQKRRRRWYAVLEIPKELRRKFGKSRFVQSLRTESRTVAEREVHQLVGEWKREIAKARNEPFEDIAVSLHRKLKVARTDKRREGILEDIDKMAWEIGATNVDQVGQSPTTDPEARDFHARATGALVGFTDYLEEWLAASNLSDKTKDMHRSAIDRFATEFKTTQAVTRAEVRRWVARQTNEYGLTPKTLQRILSGIRGYWRYLQSIEVVSDEHEPFLRLDVSRSAKRRNPKAARLPFEPKDVVNLLNAAVKIGDGQLADLIRLGMWTGCRIDEICSLRAKDVHDGYFSIKDAKTSAGWRDVPIHSKLKPTVNRLLKDSDDDHVLSGLTANKYGDRSNAIGKRFGRLKADHGFDRRHVFHSIRKTVVTILENAGVPENVVADIVGHEKTTMTYGLYSGGTSLHVKQLAIDQLSYAI